MSVLALLDSPTIEHIPWTSYPSGGDPNKGCTGICGSEGCTTSCRGNKGHAGTHACTSH